MQTPAPPLGPLFWRSILKLMDDRRVVPIVGPDAVVVDGDRGPRPLTEYLAPRLEALLELEPGEHPATDLNEVACRYLGRPGSQHGDIYSMVAVALDELRPEPPEALRKLARIDAFKLFVTTSFDDLLRQAVDAERFGGQPRTRSFAYSPGDVQDLSAPLDLIGQPVVYHLLGRASAAPVYAVTEEDTLEFVHSLQSRDGRPNRLLDELKPRSLLIIGSGYPDWLARFFLRVAKSERLLMARSKTDVVVERPDAAAAQLGTFLRHFSTQTKLYAGGALAFIDELAERWAEHDAGRPDPGTDQPAQPAPAEHAIFISYASNDRPAAAALADALVAAGLPVWFDRGGGLEGGDDWDAKIRLQIETASLFVPVLSPSVLVPDRRYFRVEWSIAGEVARGASPTLPFVVPVNVGGVSPTAPEISDFIRRAHWLAPDEQKGGLAPVVERLRSLFRDYQLSLEGSR